MVVFMIGISIGTILAIYVQLARIIAIEVRGDSIVYSLW